MTTKRLPVSTREARGSSRRGKYNAQGERIDGHWFASQAEAVRYRQLKELEAQGVIAELALQPAYPVQIRGRLVATYRADFRYAVLDERGRVERIVVEDVEGMITDVYAMKKKMVEASYDLTINEIPASKVDQWIGRTA